MIFICHCLWSMALWLQDVSKLPQSSHSDHLKNVQDPCVFKSDILRSIQTLYTSVAACNAESPGPPEESMMVCGCLWITEYDPYCVMHAKEKRKQESQQSDLLPNGCSREHRSSTTELVSENLHMSSHPSVSWNQGAKLVLQKHSQQLFLVLGHLLHMVRLH